MAEQRERSRSAGGGEDVPAAELAREAGFQTEFVGYEATDVLTQIGALQDLGDGTFLAKLRESPFYPDGGGQVSDQGWLEKDGAKAELVAAYRFGDDQALLFSRLGLRRGRPRARRRAVEGPLPDDREPHRDAPAPQGAPGGARRPRPPGGLGRAARQAALRLQPSARR